MTIPRAVETPGRLVAKVLTGSWRQRSPELNFTSEELDAITPQLLGSGAGALGWRRISDTPIGSSPSGVKLQQAYRLQSLYAGLHDEGIELAVQLLSEAGIVPLLIKGRAAAQYYSEPGLRPYGDIDLCFDSREYPRAMVVLTTPEAVAVNVDPHNGLDRFYGFSLEELLERAETIKVGKIEVRVPSFEDHLRILCIHFLKHGGWRPLSLCDVAAAIEAQPNNIDWARCQGDEQRRADWIACTIGLAHQLLGARHEGAPIVPRSGQLPRWLVPAILKQWNKPYPQSNETTEHLSAHLRHPSRLGAELGKRWPNPIRATMYLGGAFNELPRLPFQLFSFLSQGTRFLARLPGTKRQNALSAQD